MDEVDRYEHDLMQKSCNGQPLSKEDISKAYQWHWKRRRKENMIFKALLIPISILVAFDFISAMVALSALSLYATHGYINNGWIGWCALAVFIPSLGMTIVVYKLTMKYHPTARFYNARRFSRR